MFRGGHCETGGIESVFINPASASVVPYRGVGFALKRGARPVHDAPLWSSLDKIDKAGGEGTNRRTAPSLCSRPPRRASLRFVAIHADVDIVCADARLEMHMRADGYSKSHAERRCVAGVGPPSCDSWRPVWDGAA
jgi:hypothetical protein